MGKDQHKTSSVDKSLHESEKIKVPPNPHKSVKYVLKRRISKILWFWKHKIYQDVIQTTITLRTKYLSAELKKFFQVNVILSCLSLLSAVLTAISTLNQVMPNGTTIANISKLLTSDGNITNIFLFIFSILTVILSVIAFVFVLITTNTSKFINNIIRDQYDVEEFTAIFLIKMVFNNVPKLLVFRSDKWNSYFLPYCHYNEKELEEDEPSVFRKKLRIPISEILEISSEDIEIFDDFSKNDYIAIKKNPSHDKNSKINYRFYYVKFTNPIACQKFLSQSRNSYFSWKSKSELADDKDTQMGNGDVLQIIDELSLLNQSKLAFKERSPASYDISSRYRIIWNITSECAFNCPICATNSGCDSAFVCKTSLEDKRKILLNLATISGFVDHLDISGGDPLIHADDVSIIKLANQVMPYTDISVTTTGYALEKLSIEQLVSTVKTCDVTYDIPYNVCTEDLQKYRQYHYNYSNYKQLERFANSGVKIALNIHIPLLPILNNRKYVETILEDLSKINPVQIKFIRLMPVGRMGNEDMREKVGDLNVDSFLRTVQEIIREKGYKFKLAYNCSLGVKVYGNNLEAPCRNCDMLTSKLGIDACGNVYSCIWGAYLNEFKDKPVEENPFYLGNLVNQSMYDILVNPKTIKLAKLLKEKVSGCRVCGFAMNSVKDGTYTDHMLKASDPMEMVHSNLKSLES